MADAEKDSLLDVFVNIIPRFEQDLEKITEDAFKKIKDKWIGMSLPPLKAAVSGGGTGDGSSGGGRGGRGGTSGGGGGNDLADQYKEAKRAAEDLRSTLKGLALVAKSIDSKELKDDLNHAHRTLDGITKSMRRSREDNDPLGIESSLRKVNALRLSVERFSEHALPNIDSPVGEDPIAMRMTMALRRAEDLKSELRDINLLSKQAGPSFLSSDLEQASLELAKIQTQLNRAKADDDPLGFDDAIKKTSVLSESVERLKTELSDVSINRSLFEKLSVEDTRLRAEFHVKSALQQQAVQGLPAAERQSLVQSASEIKSVEAAVTAAKVAFNGSRESLENYINELIRLNGITDTVEESLLHLRNGLGAIDWDLVDAATANPQMAHGFRNAHLQNQIDLRRTQGTSFNNLSNNAYQVGQAFEDFAVGYSLNGVAGGIRGAANNIAFILNDMSRLPKVTDLATAAVQKMRPAMPLKEAAALGARYASMIPLIAGIGSALAIVVLPKLVEWLQSLDDIEAGFEDISKQLRDASENRDFQIKLKFENADLNKFSEDAESVESILQRISDLSEKTKRNQIEFADIFGGFDIKELASDSLTPLQKMTGEFDKLNQTIKESIDQEVKYDKFINRILRFQPLSQISRLSTHGRKGLAETAGDVGLETPEVLAGKLRHFKQEVFAVRRAIEDAIEQGKNGTANADTFIRAQRSIDDFRKKVEANIGRLNVSKDEQAELKVGLEGMLDTVSKDLKRAEDIAKETANAIEKSFEIAFDGVRKKIVELRGDLDLRRQVTRGANTEFDIELHELEQKINEGRKLVAETQTAIRDAASQAGIPVNEEGIRAIEEENQIRSLLSVEELQRRKAEERRDIEKQIFDIKEKQRKSSFTSFEEFSRRLQLNAFSRETDPEERLTKSLRSNAEDTSRLEGLLRAVKNEERFNQQILEPRGGFASIRERDAAEFKAAMRELLNPLGKVVDAQDRTTEAVKKIPGAVIQ